MIVRKGNGKYEYKCDFCNEVKSKSLLSDTGRDRWSVDYERFGKEAVCPSCLKLMRPY